MIVISIYSIIENVGRILLTQDFDKQGWKLPGGKVEKGEYIYEAAKREVKEETGLDIEIDGFVTIQEYFRGSGVHRFRFYVTAKLTGGKMKRGEGEVKDFIWVEIKRLKTLKEEDFYIKPYFLAVKRYLKQDLYPRRFIIRI